MSWLGRLFGTVAPDEKRIADDAADKARKVSETSGLSGILPWVFAGAAAVGVYKVAGTPAARDRTGEWFDGATDDPTGAARNAFKSAGEAVGVDTDQAVNGAGDWFSRNGPHLAAAAIIGFVSRRILASAVGDPQTTAGSVAMLAAVVGIIIGSNKIGLTDTLENAGRSAYDMASGGDMVKVDGREVDLSPAAFDFG